MASGLILGILFMRYQKWYLAAIAAGILFGIVWNLWHNTIRNCSEKDSMSNARAWIYPALRVGCFLIFFLAGAFHYAQNESFRDAYMMKLQDGMNVTVQGKLCSKQLKNGQYSYYLDHCYLSIGQEILPCNQILLITVQFHHLFLLSNVMTNYLLQLILKFLPVLLKVLSLKTNYYMTQFRI